MITVGYDRAMNPTCNYCSSADNVLALNMKGTTNIGTMISLCADCRRKLLKELQKSIPVPEEGEQ